MPSNEPEESGNTVPSKTATKTPVDDLVQKDFLTHNTEILGSDLSYQIKGPF